MSPASEASVRGRADNVTAVVVLGCGPYDLAPVAGAPAVVRAVRTVLAAGIVDNVTVLAPTVRQEAATRACVGLPVRVVDEVVAGPGVVIVHEAIRPFAPVGLVSEVLGAMRAGVSVVVPVMPVTDTVRQLDSDGELRGALDRAVLRVVQAPFAFRPELLTRFPVDALDLIQGCAAAGIPVHTVPGDPLALAVRTDWDLEFASLLPTPQVTP